jgi:hypothetical protein
MNSPVNAQIEHLLLIVIIQLVFIIAAARLFGVIFRYLGQPPVCGEIAAGIILGPSLFGLFFAGPFLHMFQSSVGPSFSILSQIGLILLMFLIGLQFDFSHFVRPRATCCDCRESRGMHDGGTAQWVAVEGIFVDRCAHEYPRPYGIYCGEPRSRPGSDSQELILHAGPYGSVDNLYDRPLDTSADSENRTERFFQAPGFFQEPLTDDHSFSRPASRQPEMRGSRLGDED